MYIYTHFIGPLFSDSNSDSCSGKFAWLQFSSLYRYRFGTTSVILNDSLCSVNIQFVSENHESTVNCLTLVRNHRQNLSFAAYPEGELEKNNCQSNAVAITLAEMILNGSSHNNYSILCRYSLLDFQVTDL